MTKIPFDRYWTKLTSSDMCVHRNLFQRGPLKSTGQYRTLSRLVRRRYTYFDSWQNYNTGNSVIKVWSVCLYRILSPPTKDEKIYTNFGQLIILVRRQLFKCILLYRTLYKDRNSISMFTFLRYLKTLLLLYVSDRTKYFTDYRFLYRWL